MQTNPFVTTNQSFFSIFEEISWTNWWFDYALCSFISMLMIVVHPSYHENVLLKKRPDLLRCADPDSVDGSNFTDP